MSEQNIKTIRRESIEAILDSIFENGMQSRREIADDTSLSLMTVGRVVETFTDCGLLTYSRSNTDSPGRKAGVSIPDTDRYYLIADKTGGMGRLYIYDALGSETKRLDLDGSLESGEVSGEYINRLLVEMTGELNFFKCMGVGVILPNDADTEAFMSLPAKFALSPFAVCADTLSSCAVDHLRFLHLLPEFGTAFYLSHEPPFGMFIFDGRPIMCESGPVGDISRLDGSVSDRLETAYRLLGFERLITDDASNLPPNLCADIRTIPENIRPSHRGMIRRLRFAAARKIVNNM